MQLEGGPGLEMQLEVGPGLEMQLEGGPGLEMQLEGGPGLEMQLEGGPGLAQTRANHSSVGLEQGLPVLRRLSTCAELGPVSDKDTNFIRSRPHQHSGSCHSIN